eukprot:gnl/Chilomastix_cuspidata/1054.p1 GENE.gnl/Chilomastix_cuspidata/1054~~gnl/Chilomastix_cuspidata/1054.p1  ORF type:complete len:2388 (-),score=674.64 gnl/Chilomastix_cuspidata/1054:26-7036(-)
MRKKSDIDILEEFVLVCESLEDRIALVEESFSPSDKQYFFYKVLLEQLRSDGEQSDEEKRLFKAWKKAFPGDGRRRQLKLRRAFLSSASDRSWIQQIYKMLIFKRPEASSRSPTVMQRQMIRNVAPGPSANIFNEESNSFELIASESSEDYHGMSPGREISRERINSAAHKPLSLRSSGCTSSSEPYVQQQVNVPNNLFSQPPPHIQQQTDAPTFTFPMAQQSTMLNTLHRLPDDILEMATRQRPSFSPPQQNSRRAQNRNFSGNGWPVSEQIQQVMPQPQVAQPPHAHEEPRPAPVTVERLHIPPPTDVFCLEIAVVKAVKKGNVEISSFNKYGATILAAMLEDRKILPEHLDDKRIKAVLALFGRTSTHCRVLVPLILRLVQMTSPKELATCFSHEIMSAVMCVPDLQTILKAVPRAACFPLFQKRFFRNISENIFGSLDFLYQPELFWERAQELATFVLEVACEMDESIAAAEFALSAYSLLLDAITKCNVASVDEEVRFRTIQAYFSIVDSLKKGNKFSIFFPNSKEVKQSRATSFYPMSPLSFSFHPIVGCNRMRIIRRELIRYCEKQLSASLEADTFKQLVDTWSGTQLFSRTDLEEICIQAASRLHITPNVFNKICEDAPESLAGWTTRNSLKLFKFRKSNPTTFPAFTELGFIRLKYKTRGIRSFNYKVFEINSLDFIERFGSAVLGNQRMLHEIFKGSKPSFSGRESITRPRWFLNKAEISIPVSSSRGMFFVIAEPEGTSQAHTAFVQTGSLRAELTYRKEGAAFLVLDEELRPFAGARVLYNGEFFEEVEQGTVVVPFSKIHPEEKTKNPIIVMKAADLTDQKRDLFFAFEMNNHLSVEQYSLSVAHDINKESLHADSTVSILSSAQIVLSGADIDFSVVESAAIHARVTHLSGLERVESLFNRDAIDVLESKTPFSFLVRENVKAVELTVKIQIPSQYDSEKFFNLVDKHTFSLDLSPRMTLSAHITYSDGSYKIIVVDCSGKTVKDVPLVVTAYFSSHNAHKLIRPTTDENGCFDLGKLHGVNILRVVTPTEIFQTPENVLQFSGSKPFIFKNLKMSQTNSAPTFIVGVGEAVRLPAIQGARKINVIRDSVITNIPTEISDDASVITVGPFDTPGEYLIGVQTDVEIQGFGVRVGERINGYILQDRRVETHHLPQGYGPFIRSVDPHGDRFRVRVEGDDLSGCFLRVRPSALVASVDHTSAQFSSKTSRPHREKLFRCLETNAVHTDPELSYIAKRFEKETKSDIARAGCSLARPNMLLISPEEAKDAGSASLPAIREQDLPKVEGPANKNIFLFVESTSNTCLNDFSFLGGSSTFHSLRVPPSGIVDVPLEALTECGVVVLELKTPQTVQRVEVEIPSKQLPKLRRVSLQKARDNRPLTLSRETQVVARETLEHLPPSSRRVVFRSYSDLLKFYSQFQKSVRMFQPLTCWSKLSEELKQKKYFDGMCHELNVALLIRDPAFFMNTVRPLLLSKIQPDIVDVWLLVRSGSKTSQIDDSHGLLAAQLERFAASLMSLNPFEAILLADIAQAYHVQTGNDGLCPHARTLLSFATHAAQTVKKELELGKIWEYAFSPFQTVTDLDVAQDEPSGIDVRHFLTMNNICRPPPQMYMPGKRSHNQVISMCKSYSETTYFGKTRSDSVNKFSWNPFWLDFAEFVFSQKPLDSFVSRNFFHPLLFNRCSEVLLAAALVVLPEDGRDGQQIILSENLAVDEDPQPFATLHMKQRIKKAEGETVTANQLVPFENYICEILVTSYASEKITGSIIYQIPEGSVPISAGGVVSGVEEIMIAPFTTQRFNYSFMFVECGEFPHTAAIFSSEGRFACSVEHDDSYWPAISVKPLGTALDGEEQGLLSLLNDPEHVCEFIEKAPLHEFVVSAGKTSANFWDLPSTVSKVHSQRLSKDRDFYLEVTAALRKRGVLFKDIWNHCFIHQDVISLGEFLQCSRRVLDNALPDICYLKTPSLTLSPFKGFVSDARSDGLTHLDFYPLISSRTFRLTQLPEALETVAELREHYRAFLLALAMGDPDIVISASVTLQLTYLLLLQDRFEEAKELMDNVSDEIILDPEAGVQAWALAAFVELATAREKTLKVTRLSIKKFAHNDKVTPAWKGFFGKVAEHVEAIDRPQTYGAIEGHGNGIELEETDDGEFVRITVRCDKPAPLAHVSVYPISIEEIFSLKPRKFETMKRACEEFSTVLPAVAKLLPLEDSVATLTVPKQQTGNEFVVQVRSGADKFSSSFLLSKVKIIRSDDTIIVQHRETGEPVARCYVKIIARVNQDYCFWKDGYTDLAGHFMFKISLMKIEDVTNFFIFVDAKELGVTTTKLY